MNMDIEKQRNELTNKENQIIDFSISEDNTLLEISEEKIYMEFIINNYNYIAFTEDSKETEEMEMMFAKIEFIDGNRILRNIDTIKEYEIVINEFNRRLELISN